MSFARVPAESKSQINKAGQILCGRVPATQVERERAEELAAAWRACHAYPINTFQSTLRTKLKTQGFQDYIVAQRLKRLPTIVDKLRRHGTMQLTTMQDIGGVRAILPSVADVYALGTEYQQSPYFSRLLDNIKDYITAPRDEDGYRGLHLIFKYQNVHQPSYNGLRIEIQIRTKLQHAWATAVETMGTFLGQALKSRQGDQVWLDFFAAVACAFAHKENTTISNRFAHLSRAQIFRVVSDMEANLRVVENMTSTSLAISTDSGVGSSYYLIILDSTNRTTRVVRYNRESIEQATADYSQIESEVTRGTRLVEPVLVSSGSLETIRRAYPNFFLDTREFVYQLALILDEARGTNIADGLISV